MQYNNLKKYIYKIDPEKAHNSVESILKNIGDYAPFLLNMVAKKYRFEDNRLSQELFGRKFPNPVGLAAGFDKDATMIKALWAINFGFIEFGTVTPKPQDGNKKPRVFRFVEQNSLQNAMGFNNRGLEFVKKRVEDIYPFKVPIGANIGKNRDTLESDILEDYKRLIDSFKDISDYIVINISSPNTPGLRDLQNEEFIKAVFNLGVSLTEKPLLLKIAPDLDVDDAISICSIAIESGASGIVATNTTIDYSLLDGAKDFGGVSGEVLREKSYRLFLELAKEFYGKTKLISVGGVSDGDEAYRRLKAGASLIQIYSSLIFKGPNLPKEINQRIVELMDADGFKNIGEVIGADRR